MATRLTRIRVAPLALPIAVRYSSDMVDLPLDEGQLIAGKFRVESVIGSGAMGVVAAAWHLELAQRVAVKFVRREAMNLRDAEERFRREARAAARIRSEHVTRVMDVGVLPDGTPYMVMEFLDGHDLAQELSLRGCLPVAEAVGYVLQAIEALAEAHVAGIVHRDLKPANLFLARRPDGSRIIKILDFGVSKSLGSSTGDLALTQNAALIGSPLYMAPEQMRSARDIDARADVWSLGVTLYELVCGRPPYLQDSIAELITAMNQAPPPLSKIRPHIPEALERVIEHCLQPDLASRFPDVATLGAALTEFAPDMRIHAERARRVLGLSSAQSFDAVSKTLPAATEDSSSTTHRTGPTVAAWAGSQGALVRKPYTRWLALGLVLGAAVAAVWLGPSLIKRRPSTAGQEIGAAAPAPANDSVSSLTVVLPVPSATHAIAPRPTGSTEPSQPKPLALASSVPSTGVEPSRPKQSAVTNNRLVGARKPPLDKPAASAGSQNSSSVPDFGGRR